MKYIPFLILILTVKFSFAQMTTGSNANSRYYGRAGQARNFWRDGEILSPDSMLINGKLPPIMTTTQLKQIFNNPDKILPDAFDCCTYWESSDEKDYWYGNSTFLVLQDSAVINEMYFTDDRFFIKTPKITFSKNTTYDEASTVFPISIMVGSIKELKSNVDAKKTKYITFPIRMTKESDDIWTLFFKDRHLIFIDCSTGGKY